MEAHEYDQLPQNVKNILLQLNEDNDLYSECERIKTLLNKIGYSLNYGLCGTITDVFKLTK
jgi:hypothetical protein